MATNNGLNGSLFYGPLLQLAEYFHKRYFKWSYKGKLECTNCVLVYFGTESGASCAWHWNKNFEFMTFQAIFDFSPLLFY